MKVIELINKNIKEIKKVGIRNWFYFVILLRRNKFHPSLYINSIDDGEWYKKSRLRDLAHRIDLKLKNLN